ncbi:MAG: hypothetical protein NTZ26_00875, partial [Candidatus Aminicenantes bacterium]|nr:hypothetical protein [Candidatus Aminicenantes bacterium]
MILDPDGVERDWKAGYLPPAEDFMAWLQSAVDGRLTVRDLRRRIQAEPKNPEVRILLGRKHQERHQRDEALALFREAAALDPKGVLMTRTGDGAVVSCRELAEFETARTYTVTWGTMERDWMPKFIKSHP